MKLERNDRMVLGLALTLCALGWHIGSSSRSWGRTSSSVRSCSWSCTGPAGASGGAADDAPVDARFGSEGKRPQNPPGLTLGQVWVFAVRVTACQRRVTAGRDRHFSREAHSHPCARLRFLPILSRT